MQESAQVVRLQVEAERLTRARCARLPAVVQAVQDEGRRLLKDLLCNCFATADDSLFKLANGAGSNAEQAASFDAMRELRVQRPMMEARFFLGVDEAFASLADSAGAKRERVEAPSVLALVADDELEQTVALEAVVKRAARELAPSLSALARGLSTLVPEPVSPANNPFGPDVLATLFMEQLQRLDLDLKSRLLVFKQFDRNVIAGLGAVLQALLDVLAQHGIRVPVEQAQQAPSTKPSTAQTRVDAPPEDQPDLRTLARQLNQSAGLVSSAAFAGVSTPGANRPGETAIEAQGLPQPRKSGHRRAGSGAGWLSDLPDFDAQALAGDAGKAQSGSLDTAHVIGELFDYLNRDADIAAPLRRRLSRLHQPVTQLALADEAFFSNGNHSARRLLNALTTAGLGLTEDGPADAVLERCLDRLVDRLENNFDGSSQAFELALQELEQFLAQEHRRSTLVERRTLAAEDGRARTEQARERVAREILHSTAGFTLPAAAWALIDGPWRSVLLVTGLRGGFACAQWRAHSQTLKELVQSVQPPADAAARQHMIQLIPEVMRRLRAGLELISQHSFELAQRLADLERVHLALISGEPLPEDAQPAPAPAAPSPAVPEKAAPAFSPATLRQLDGLATGAWLEFDAGDGARKRCRLAACIKATGRYIFVNRTGVKVAERSREEFATELESGAVRLLSDSMLFDRALEKIVGGLRPGSANSEPAQDQWRD